VRSFRIILTLALLVSCALAETPQQIADQLRPNYVGKIFVIRGFYSGETLIYDDAGKPLSVGPAETWTLAETKITDLTATGAALHIEGQRQVVLFMPDGSKKVVDRPKLSEQGGATPPTAVVSIALPLSPDGNASEASAGLKRILASPDDIASVAPACWHRYFGHMMMDVSALDPGEIVARIPGGPPAYRVGKDVTKPSAIATPDPTYPDIAQVMHAQGKVGLWVMLDGFGRVADVQVAKPVGAGLDEAAVAAVKQWRFEAAKKDGLPVPVVMNIGVEFGLH